jgi:nucleoid-associated protein YgaU
MKIFERALQIDPQNGDARRARLKAEEARKKSSTAVPRNLFYIFAASALVIGLIAAPVFEHLAGRGPHRTRNDSDLAATVRRQFARYPAVAALNLTMHQAGGQLTISGEVPTELHKALVAEIAGRLSGNQATVTTNITVRPATPTAEPPSGFMYRVRPGDTLSVLSQRFYGGSQHWARIVAANEEKIPNPGSLAVGENLLIPFR